MDSLYALSLRLIRAYLRVRRAVARRLPEGSGEVAGALAHVNFLRLVLTLFALAIVPDHFFRRLDRLIARKFLIFSSPVQTLIQLASLIGVLKLMGAVHSSQERTLAILLILGLSGPIWTYTVIIAVNYLTLFINRAAVFFTGIGPVAMLFVVARALVTPDWLDTALTMMLSAKSLGRLNWPKYLQGMLIFAAYSCLALPICLLPAAVLATPTVAHLFQSDEPVPTFVSQAVILALALALWITTSWLFLRPLSLLFLHCLKSPGEASLKYETLRLQRLSIKAYSERNPGISLTGTGDRDPLIIAALSILLARWKCAEFRLARSSSTELQVLLDHRRKLTGDMLQFRLFIDRRLDTAIAEKLDRLEAGLPLAG
jgi:hypothetical protein